MSKKPTQFDFWFAVNNTEIVMPPKRHLETFGNTIINYYLVSELMDAVGKIRIREGRMQALRPQIITPSSYSTTMLEGFGDQAKQYLEWLKDNEDSVRILRYGYTLKQEAFSEQVLTDTPEAVLERVKQDVERKSDPFAAIIKGVDDPWDVCLVRLFWAVIQNSAPSNIRELHERHVLEMQDGLPAGLRDEIEKGFQAAAKDANLIRPLGKLLQDNGLFDRFQDRFFNLISRG
ncbi:MAG: hypothetical protein LBV54_02785 [Puniceicoccales bacterium]|jgi:hypothetical protein|nr:hypothetical protein [Puniceicoccales bacterium]